MKRLLKLAALAAFFIGSAFAQNYTTVTASNIQNLGQTKLAAGQLCFLATDNADNPITFQAGGGGQVIVRALCTTVTTGAVSSFTVPNPANTNPQYIAYRITVVDTSTGQQVIYDPNVQFVGATFNFDNYAPAGGQLNAISGTTSNGNLNVNGALSVTGGISSPSFNPLIVVANAGTTGTTLNKLTKLTGAPSTAVIAATTDTGGIIGITVGGAGTTGSASIQTMGGASCVFDGATTANDYVQISSTVAGDCHDSGATYPTSGQAIGRIFSTNGSGGTYSMVLFSPEIKGGSGGGAVASVFSRTGTVTAQSGDYTAAQVTNAFDKTTANTLTNVAAPSTPSAGSTSAYVDSTDKRLHDKNDAGAIGTTVVADTGAANNFLTAISAAGVISKAQPAFSNISGTVTNAQLANSYSGVGTCATSNWVHGVNANAAPSCTQPAFSDLSGSVAIGQTPLTTLGDLLYANATPALARLAGNITTTKQFLSQTGNGSTSAAPAWAQPAFSDLSGSHSCAQSPALTGDVTASAGSCATTNVNLPDGVTQAGSLVVTDIAAPASPAAAHLKVFGDSTDLRFHDKNAAGTIGTTVVSDTGAANNYISAISPAGLISKSRPACATLSDSTASCSTDTTVASNISSGTLPAGRMPALTGAVTSSAGAVATSPGKIDALNASAFCSDAGSTDAYACNLSPAITAYVTGTHYRFLANTANTGAATINFNSLGAKTVKKAAGGITTDLADNDIRVGQWVDVVYDGTNMQMQSTLGNAATGGSGVTSIATTSPITGGTITTTGTIACPTCVTSAAALTSNALVLGAGSQASSVLGSLGTTTTVLHGNAAGAPSFSAIVQGDVTNGFEDLSSTQTVGGAKIYSAAAIFQSTLTAKTLENCQQVDGVGYTTINAAITAIGSNPGCIEVTAGTTLSSNATVPANVELIIRGAGLITQGGSATLTINGAFDAPATMKIFSGFSAGQVTFAEIAAVTVDWFGAVNDGSYVQGSCGQTAPLGCYTGTNNDAAVLSAIKALPPGGGQVWFPRTLTTWVAPQAGIYMIGSGADCTAGASTSAGVASLIQVPDGVNLWGESQLGTVVMQNPSTNCIMFVNSQGATLGNWAAGFHQFRMDGNAIYDATHNDTVFHPSNNNSTNTGGCGIYWNTQVRSTTESPALLLDDIYVTGMNGLSTCNNSAVDIYGSGYVMSRNMRIGYNQWTHGMWFKASDSAFDKLYMVLNGGWNGFENLVLQCGGDNRFFNGYMGGGDGGTAQIYLQGATNNKFVGMTDDLAAGVDMRFTDGAACSNQPSSYNQITGGQITRPGGGAGTQANGISFEGGASYNMVTGVLFQGATGGTPIAIAESGSAGNNSIVGNAFTNWGGGAYGLRQFSNSQWQANVGSSDNQETAKHGFAASITTAGSYNLPALMPAPLVAPTIACSNSGGSLAAATYFVKITFNNTTAGETTASPEASCTTTGATGSVTVTAPTLPPNSTGYSTYDFTTTGGEKKQSASANCGNITGNCVVTTVAAGAAPPASNTASAAPTTIGTTVGDVGIISSDGTAAKNIEVHTLQSGVAGGQLYYDNGGTNNVDWEAPSSLTASYTQVLPIAAPTVASNLQTDTCTSSVCNYSFKPANTVLTVTSDFTDSSSTSLQAITGLSYTFPANLAVKAQFDCDIIYHQNTAAVADNWGVQDVTVAPTNVFATGFTQTAATTWSEQQLLTLATTTATAIGATFTPSAITTDWHARVRLLVEHPSNASSSALNIMMKQATAADTLTVRHGSNCSVNFQ